MKENLKKFTCQCVSPKFLEAYREKLRLLKVLDPACGSGAFLNQVFDFLYNEGQSINADLAHLQGGQTSVFDLSKHILTNNLYGVDINEESVEITKFCGSKRRIEIRSFLVPKFYLGRTELMLCIIQVILLIEAKLIGEICYQSIYEQA